MTFLDKLRYGSGHGSSTHTVRSGAYSHRSAKESVGRRVHADGMSMSRNHDGNSTSSRVGVGTVLVMLQETVDGPQPPPLRVLNKDGKIIPRDHFFLALIAPDSDQALAFLAVQPAGTYILVKETVDDLTVYVKFQAAVRSFPVVAGKDIKRAKPSDELVEWGRAYRPLAVNTPHAEALLGQSTQMTPIHRLYLPPAEFTHLEKCWLHFLPHVQAIAFELCTQPYYMDEEIAMEEWDTFILSSRVACVAFVSVDSCGFHLFNTSAIAHAAGTDTGSLSANVTATAAAAITVPVRVVEFDISKCVITIADGVFRPNSLVSTVHFAPTKLYDAELGFAAIRENFLAPDRVALKELNGTPTIGLSGTAVASTPTLWQDLNPHAASGDAELQHLLIVRTLVMTMVPHEPLPEGLIHAIETLHTLWAGQTAMQSRGHWRMPAKIKCVAQILSFYVELFLATATTDPYTLQELARTGRPDHLPRFAMALRHDLLFMARRADDATIARLVHHVLQALALRAAIPAALITLVSDLCVESAHFRELLLRNQGANLFWKAIHTAVTISALDAVGLPLLLQAQASFERAAPPISELSKRRSSLFGGRRRSNQQRGASRKSLAFNASIVMPVTFETHVQVFFRVNPLLVQLELASLLRENEFAMESVVGPTAIHRSSWPVTSIVSSALNEMISFIERLAFVFMADAESPTWEKDVLQLLRLEELYDQLYRELVSCIWMDKGLDDDTRRLETILECIGALFRLETMRRRHAGHHLGEKKYWFLFHLLRNPVRAFHEHLYDQLSMRTKSMSIMTHEEDDQVSEDTRATMDETGFVVLTRVLPQLPRPMVTEFVLVSLDDILQAARLLHQSIGRQAPNRSVIKHIRLLLQLLTLILRRTSDFDLQLVLVRVLASSGSAIPALLQVLVKETSVDRTAIELEVLAFAEAFVTLASSLLSLEKWHTTRDVLVQDLDNPEDLESNEQRKTMLMATVLSPENGVSDSDEILWDTLHDLLLLAPPLEPGRARLTVVEAFYSKAVFTQSDALLQLFHDKSLVQAMQYYIRVRARLFLSPMLENPHFTRAQLRGLVDLHWDYLYDLRQHFKTLSDTTSEDLDVRKASHELTVLHLRCLMALSSRCSQLPAVDEAFTDSRISRELYRFIYMGSKETVAQETVEEPVVSNSSTLTLNLSKLGSHVGSTAPLQTTELLLSSPVLHATTLLTILAGLLSDPHALNERLVPRFFLPTNIEGSSTNLLPDEDLLLSLQRHLRVVETPELYGFIEMCLHEAEVDYHCGSPARVHALRVLVRLLLPNSYDAHLYTRADPTTSATHVHKHTTVEGADEDVASDDESHILATSHPREYVAKGAFATVYRTLPCVGNTAVAIKACGHQRSSGELCVAAEVFNEVTVLEHLRGNLAATQLVDFGNNTTESLAFELVVEYCPASLTQWRRSLHLDGHRLPFRTLLGLSFGAVIDIGRALAQIHASRVCHFDLKADNVLLRVEPLTLTAELLRDHASVMDSSAIPRLCLADFGESMIMPSAGRELQLTRTRGTEAIKSPEMLRVVGGTPTSGIGPQSDVWSLGCLLYELVTEELMFGNDDWAQLFAHLVVPTQTTTSTPPPVVREDHKQKLLDALAPVTDAEKGLATVFLLFLETILERDASKRPSLDAVIAEAEIQRRMILSLTPSIDDEAYHATVQSHPSSDAVVPVSSTPLSLSNVHPPASLGPSAARLFFNFFLAQDLSGLRSAVNFNDNDAQRGTLLHDARRRHELSSMQNAVEPRFGHFVYFCYDDLKRSALRDSDLDLPAPDTRSSHKHDAFVEIVEGVGRTVCYFNRAKVLACLATDDKSFPSHIRTNISSVHSSTSARGTAPSSTSSSPSLAQYMLEYSRGILSVFLRHARHRSRVLLVAADDRHDRDSSMGPLRELTLASMLFFMTTSLEMTPLDAVAAIRRESSGFLSARVLASLLHLHEELTAAILATVTVERAVHHHACVRCRCGDKVLAVTLDVLNTTERFAPPVIDVEDDADVVWDPHEARLVVGACGRGPAWPIVDARAVTRLDSIMRLVLRRQLGVTKPTNHGGALRHASIGHGGSRHVPIDEALRVHVPYLLHGLAEQHSTRHSNSNPTDGWTVLECRQCGARVCAVNATADRLALPL